MNKRIFAALLALAMVVALLPGTALAVADYTMDFATNASLLWIGGKNPAGDNCSGTGWAWYAEETTTPSGVTYAAKTLVLDDFHFTTTTAVALKLPAGSTVIVSGNNTFTSGQADGANDSISIGISVLGDLKVEGRGTLKGQGGSATTTGAGKTAKSYGVYVYGSTDGKITVSSGTLTGQGGSATGTSGGTSCGVMSRRDIEVSGGTLKGQGGSATTAESTGTAISYGVFSYSGSIEVSGGTLNGQGGGVAGSNDSRSYGVNAVGYINVRGGTLTGQGGDIDASGNSPESIGVFSGAGITVSGGTLNGIGGSVSGANVADSRGMSTPNYITVSGGAVTAKSDTEAIHAADGFGFSGHYDTAANRRVAAGASEGTASAWTGNASQLNGVNNETPYKYVRIMPAALPITIAPDTAFPAGMSGGDRTVTVGHGTGLAADEIGTLSVGNYTLVENTDYTKANSASVNITLKESWLNSLPAGTHRLNVPVTSGTYAPQTPYIDIVVIGTGGAGGDVGADIPKTGDGAMPLLWAGLVLLAGAGLIVLKKRRRA